MATSQASTKPPTYHPALTQRTGAPSSYRPEYCEAIVAYFQVRADSIAKNLPLSRDADKEPIVWQHLQMPTFPGFAGTIGVTSKALGEWAQRHAAFGDAYARAKDIHRMVYEDGLACGRLNPTGAIFAAKNVLGWRDKIDIDQTTTQVDAGSTVMQACLASATPDELTQFRALLDTMKLRAIADGRLTVDGQAVAQAALPA
jgi:hypothetical protein